jgi:hypothetical protein
MLFGAHIMANPQNFPSLLRTMLQAQSVSASDIARLRGFVAESSKIDEETAVSLIQLNQTEGSTPGWDAFFIDTISEYVICDMAPIGYVSHENAQWLINQISENGLVPKANSIDLLICVLERGICVPPELSAFTLSQVAQAIATGTGPLRPANTLSAKGVVGGQDVDMLNRILLAFGNFGEVAITRAEAEVLLDINDVTSEAHNDPAWSDLFIKSITNLLMAASGYSVPARAKALLREPWQHAVSDSVSNFLVQMLSNLLTSYRAPSTQDYWEARNTTWVELPENSKLVTQDEASWLAGRIGRDGKLHENEKELLTFLSAKVPSIHPALQELVNKVAA